MLRAPEPPRSFDLSGTNDAYWRFQLRRNRIILAGGGAAFLVLGLLAAAILTRRTSGDLVVIGGSLLAGATFVLVLFYVAMLVPRKTEKLAIEGSSIKLVGYSGDGRTLDSSDPSFLLIANERLQSGSLAKYELPWFCVLFEHASFTGPVSILTQPALAAILEWSTKMGLQTSVTETRRSDGVLIRSTVIRSRSPSSPHAGMGNV
jgi:hypothetical protein